MGNELQNEFVLSENDSLNENIRNLAKLALTSITNKDDTAFTSITTDMIQFAEYTDKSFGLEIKYIVYSTCYDLHEKKISRNKIATSFYDEVLKCCNLFLN